MTCIAPCPNVEVLDCTRLAELERDWEALLERSYDDQIFLTPTWYRVWWDHFAAERSHVLMLPGGNFGLRALLPIQMEQRDGQRVLGLAGDYNVADYMDALADREDAQELLEQLWACALAELHWDRIELRHVPAESPLIPALAAAASKAGVEVRVERDEVCPVAMLADSWEGYLQTLGKKQRHEIRRKLRRAEEGVEWSWRTAKTLDDLSSALPIFFRLHEASAHEKARFMTVSMRSFFHALAASMLHRGVLRLSILQRDGVNIAAVMAFLYRGHYLLYNSGYDPAYAAHSPGIAAVAHAMQDAIAEKAVAFDFLCGDEPYKYQFGARNTYTSRVVGARALR